MEWDNFKIQQLTQIRHQQNRHKADNLAYEKQRPFHYLKKKITIDELTSHQVDQSVTWLTASSGALVEVHVTRQKIGIMEYIM